ncbi:NAD(P)/FAD-dependent oxidoreductase [Arcicella rosea]|uniref:NAD(P)H-nitrite reductase large subunit n=1 Tax=Arcicella rosea TaxID=502909 RepID=A0A841EYW6_9BACT|nr:FAD/NAD(P)-binding oxidoreductase [Arcicella rosea]MBB6004691.1 NAD(P)H-nitrite reductase large subunit [Arcicella rosea]
MKHIVIVGNGIAGITAARHIRKLSDYKITVISSESKYFFSRTALMYVYMGQMKYEHIKPYEDWFWEKNRIELKYDKVESINIQRKNLQLTKELLQYDKLILATGSNYNTLPNINPEIKGVQGLYHLQDLEKLEENTKNINKAVIVGGGLIGVELAEMLISRNIEVTFLIRENTFWGNVLPIEEANIVTQHLKKMGIGVLINTELKEIYTSINQRVVSILTSKEEKIACEFVGLTIGVSPNIDLVKNTSIESQKGILVNEYLETNEPDIYAIGDCVEHKNPLSGRKAIEQIWYSGKLMGETVAKSICGSPTKYKPDIFYNSAKFFEIEYQVYGKITQNLSANEQTFYWKNTENNKCLRINYEAESNSIIGIHALGIRLRQAICEKWIRDKCTIQYVLEHLEEANFNPEFSKPFINAMLEKYNQEYPENPILIKKKKSITNLISKIFN